MGKSSKTSFHTYPKLIKTEFQALKIMKKIQDYQINFDKEHFPEWKNVSYDQRLLYITTALTGELGEFANIVKKRHRKIKKK